VNAVKAKYMVMSTEEDLVGSCNTYIDNLFPLKFICPRNIKITWVTL
jgi:hypothetical protein